MSNVLHTALNSKHLRVMWFAYLFSYCNVTFGISIGTTMLSIDLLPNFVGSLYIIYFIKELGNNYPELKRLTNFVWFLFFVDLLPAAEFLTELLLGSKITLADWVPFALLCTIMRMYLWYTLFTIIGKIYMEYDLRYDDLYLIRNFHIGLTLLIFLLYQYLNQLDLLLLVLLLIPQIILLICLKWSFDYRARDLDERTRENQQEIIE